MKIQRKNRKNEIVVRRFADGQPTPDDLGGALVRTGKHDRLHAGGRAEDRSGGARRDLVRAVVARAAGRRR